MKENLWKIDKVSGKTVIANIRVPTIHFKNMSITFTVLPLSS